MKWEMNLTEGGKEKKRVRRRRARQVARSRTRNFTFRMSAEIPQLGGYPTKLLRGPPLM